jgi:hypothetical protein
MTDASLAALLDESAAERDDVERIEGEGSVTFRRAGLDFAILEADGRASFRLGSVLAPAASRTPAVVASERGPDWVRFGPPLLDRFARDRASSWFEAAYRRAAEA